jgi:hypothetical protein
MHQSFFYGYRGDVIVVFGMCEGFIDVIKHHASGAVISFDRLQTGDVTQKGGSRETAECQYRVVTLG